jgi:hypothetical protein
MIPRCLKTNNIPMTKSKQSHQKLFSWLCSTTFIVSPIFGDVFDFRIDHTNELGSTLNVARFDNQHLRSASSNYLMYSKSISLNSFTGVSS